MAATTQSVLVSSTRSLLYCLFEGNQGRNSQEVCEKVRGRPEIMI